MQQIVRNENLLPECWPLLLHFHLLLFQFSLPLCSEVGKAHLLHHQLLVWIGLHVVLGSIRYKYWQIDYWQAISLTLQ